MIGAACARLLPLLPVPMPTADLIAGKAEGVPMKSPASMAINRTSILNTMGASQLVFEAEAEAFLALP